MARHEFSGHPPGAIVAGEIAENFKPIDELLTEAIDPVQWTGGDAFKIQMARLNGSLQMGGDAFPDPS